MTNFLCVHLYLTVCGFYSIEFTASGKDVCARISSLLFYLIVWLSSQFSYCG